MSVALNFSGGGQSESSSLTIASGQLPRIRWTAFAGSAKCQLKTVVGGVTSLVTITDTEQFLGLAFGGDVLTVVYDGQGNPASSAVGILEAVS